MISINHCLICKGGKKNRCLHWHTSPEDGSIWVWCTGICQRGYSIWEYAHKSGISIADLYHNRHDMAMSEAVPNQVQKMEWPQWFVSMSDPRAEKGVEYVKSRGLTVDGDMYYDLDKEGIVFPYYFQNHFVGAQIRFIVPRTTTEGDEQKMDTLPGTRLGLVFYGWNQEAFVGDVKGVIVTEGAFNALSIAQAVSKIYGGFARCPWRAIACSGSGATQHQTEALKELKDRGVKVVIAPDYDEAGTKMLKKMMTAECATHYALTGMEGTDWNDALQQMGQDVFGKWFMSQIKKV